MKCPKCKHESLEPFGGVDGVEVDFCSHCKSIWFEAGELAFYIESSRDVPDIASAIESGQSTSEPCPTCQVNLITTYYVPNNPLQIDICPSCRGILLEPGELPHVEAIAVKKGGLTRIAHTVKALEEKGYAVIGMGS